MLLIIIDGLDEIFDGADRQRVMQEISGFTQRYPRSRIVVTSRPVGYKQQVQQAEQRIERVLCSVKQSRPIRLLAGNPMLLTIMSLLAREEELPRERVKFYEKAVEVLCHHWDANCNLELPDSLNANEKKIFCGGLRCVCKWGMVA